MKNEERKLFREKYKDMNIVFISKYVFQKKCVLQIVGISSKDKNNSAANCCIREYKISNYTIISIFEFYRG